MKYILFILLFVACKQNESVPKGNKQHWGLVYNSETGHNDIMFLDSSGNWNTIKINWEDGTALITTTGGYFAQIHLRLKNPLYDKEKWSNVVDSPLAIEVIRGETYVGESPILTYGTKPKIGYYDWDKRFSEFISAGYPNSRIHYEVIPEDSIPKYTVKVLLPDSTIVCNHIYVAVEPDTIKYGVEILMYTGEAKSIVCVKCLQEKKQFVKRRVDTTYVRFDTAKMNKLFRAVEIKN